MHCHRNPSEKDGKKFVLSEFNTTEDHPWRTAANEWVKTMELKPGVEVLRARGPPARVISVENTDRAQPTFNLEVADFHTYFVGQQRIWVHNGVCNLALRAAVKKFPGKAGRIEEHHVTPIYLGGATNGTKVSLDAAYHQEITNEFRRLWPYGQAKPTSQRLEQLMQEVYDKYPLPE